MNFRHYLKRIRQSVTRGRHRYSPGRAFQPPSVERLEDRMLLAINLLGIPSWVSEDPGPILKRDLKPGAFDTTDVFGVGAVNMVAPDPANASRLFAATVNGGVWETDDALDSYPGYPEWHALTDQFPSLSTSSIAFSPLDPHYNTLFAGIGVYSSGEIIGGGPLTGLLKTTDGGRTWTLLGGLAGMNVRRVIPTAIQGTQGQVLLVDVRDSPVPYNDGIWRSADGGLNWDQVLTAPATDLVAEPGNQGHFFTSIASDGILVSSDGTSWADVSGNIKSVLQQPANDIQLTLHHDPDKDVVYAALVGTPLGSPVRVFRLEYPEDGKPPSGGWQWAEMTSPFNSNEGLFNTFGGFVADPRDPLTVYIAGEQAIGAPIEAGHFSPSALPGQTNTTWESLVDDGAHSTRPHADYRTLVFDAANNLLNTNDGGIWRLHDVTNPATRGWADVLGDLANTELYSAAYDSLTGSIFGGAQDNGSPAEFQGTSWQDQTGGDGGRVAVVTPDSGGYDKLGITGQSIHYMTASLNASGNGLDGFSRQTFNSDGSWYAPEGVKQLVVSGLSAIRLNSGRVRISDGRGNIVDGNGKPIYDPVGNLPVFAVSAVDPTRMVIGTRALYESFDQGDHLTPLGAVQTIGDLGDGTLDFVVMNPLGDFVNAMAYGGMRGGQPNSDVLWVGTNGQLLLRTSGAGLPAPVTSYPGTGVLGIAVDRDDWQHVFVLDTAGSVYETHDAGQTSWTNLTANLPGLTSDPSLNGGRPVVKVVELFKEGGNEVLLAGGYGGVYRMINPALGASWSKFGRDLPHVIVNDLHYVRPNSQDPARGDLLVAGTWGRGAWVVPDASQTLATPGEVVIDALGSSQDTTAITLERDTTFTDNPSSSSSGLLDVFVADQTTDRFRQVEVAAVQKITVRGEAGTNNLTLDFSAGSFLPPGGLSFDGGKNTNSLVLENGTFKTESYSLADGANFTTVLDGGTISAVNVQSVTDTARVNGLLEVDVPIPSQPINVVDGPNGTTQINSGSSPTFSTVNFANKTSLKVKALGGHDYTTLDYPQLAAGLTSLTINGGPGGTVQAKNTPAGFTPNLNASGDDPVIVGNDANSLDGIQGPLMITGAGATDTLILNDQGAGSPHTYTITAGTIRRDGAALITYAGVGSLTVNANAVGSGPNTILVGGTPPGTATTISAERAAVNLRGTSGPVAVVGGGDDAVTIGSLAPALGGTLAGVNGPVWVGNASGRTDLTVDDSGDGGRHPNVTLGAGALQRLGPAEIDFAPPGLRSLTIWDGAGGDTYTVTGTGAGYTTTLYTSGADRVNLVGGGTPQGFQGSLVIAGGGTGPVPLSVDDSRDTAPRTITLDSATLADGAYGRITGLGQTPILYRYSDTSAVTLQTGSGGAVVNVLATAVPVTLTGHGSNTTVNVGSAGSVQGIAGALTVSNSGGSTALNVDDSADPVGRRVAVTSSALTGLAPAGINYQPSSLSALNVATGSPNTGTFADFSSITVWDTPGGCTTTLNVGTNNGLNNGGVYVAGTTGPLVVNRHSTPASPDVRVEVGNPTPTGDGSTLANVRGPVTFTDTAPKTWVVIEDASDTARRSVTFSDHDVRFGGGLSAVINYQAAAMLGSVVVQGGSGGNTFTVAGTAAGVAADLRVGPGGDAVNVWGSSPGGTVLVRNVPGFADTVTVGSPTPQGRTLANIHGHVLLPDDLSHTDLVVDNSGDPTSHDGVTHPALNFWGNAFNGFDLTNYYTSIETIGVTRNLRAMTIYEGSGTDRLDVQGTAPGTRTTIHADNPLKAGSDADTINVRRYDASGNPSVKTVVSPLMVYGRPDKTAVTLDDSGTGPADQVTIRSQQVGGSDNFFGPGGSLTYLGLKNLTVNTASNPTAADTITLSPNPGTAYFINGGAVNNSLTLNLGGLPTPAVMETGPGSGSWTFGGRPGVTYTGIANQQVTGASSAFLLGPVGTAGSPQPSFHWVGVAGAARYELVVWDITNPSAPQLVLDDANVTGTSRPAASRLLVGHRYRWAVRAFDGLGNPGSWSSPLKFTVAGPVP
jgi:hypothetical protein